MISQPTTTFLLLQFDRKLTFIPNLRVAARRFEQKFGTKPNTFFVHPSAIRRNVHFRNMRIIRKETVLPNTVGVARKDAKMQTIVIVIIGESAQDIADQCNALVGNAPDGYPTYAVDKVLTIAMSSPNVALVVVQVSSLLETT